MSVKDRVEARNAESAKPEKTKVEAKPEKQERVEKPAEKPQAMPEKAKKEAPEKAEKAEKPEKETLKLKAKDGQEPDAASAGDGQDTDTESDKKANLPPSRLKKILENHKAKKSEPDKIDRLAETLEGHFKPKEEAKQTSIPDYVTDPEGYNAWVDARVDEKAKAALSPLQEEIEQFKLETKLNNYRSFEQKLSNDPKTGDAIDYIKSVAANTFIQARPELDQDTIAQAVDFAMMQLKEKAESLGFRNNISGYFELYARERGYTPEVFQPQEKELDLEEKRKLRERAQSTAGIPSKGTKENGLDFDKVRKMSGRQKAALPKGFMRELIREKTKVK